MDTETEVSKNLLFEKTGSAIAGIGQTILKKIIGLYARLEDSSLSLKKLLLEKKLQVKTLVRNKKNRAWEDNSKKIMESFLKKGDFISGPLPVEAGILGLLAIKKGAEVLELGCGDGFDAKNFFSTKAYHITAIDSDHDAIKHASTNNSASNITYKLCDFTRDMTVGMFDTVVWNKGPEEFSKEIAESIVANTKIRLNEGGILTGSSNFVTKAGWLNNAADLEQLLYLHFSHVKIKESGCHPGSYYFFASEKEVRLI